MPGSSPDSNNGPEPPMYLQRPSSARSQDVSHVLARTFRQLFMRDAVGSDTVHYLTKSRGGDNAYHEKYVEMLEKVQEERDRRMAQAAMLERHIMQAQARAMSADERALNRVSSGVSKFPDLGLPPPRAHFLSCIDHELLRKNNLITPEDFTTEESPPVPAPQAPHVPGYARETMSSTKKKMEEDGLLESPLPDDDSNIDGGLSDRSESLSSLHSVSKSVENIHSAPKRQKSLWKSQINPELREVNRADLSHLQAKVDYLKNPRHIPPSASGARSLIKAQKKQPKEIGIKPKQEKEVSKEHTTVFIASPQALTFTDYTVGQVYELTLELKNVTTLLRPVRVVPPKTTYFSVGLGQFPGEHGLVAPGMSCHYTVMFAPDSLGDFDDELIIQTQSSQALTIPIQGRRHQPALTLPEQIDIGQCLVGGCKLVKLNISNTGGAGRFCIMKNSQWPSNNFKAIVKDGFVSMPPFEVRPAMFQLSPQESTVVEVMFRPPTVQSYSEVLTVVCDNCQVKHFTLTGEGETAAADLVSVEGGLSQAMPGEFCDISAQHLVRFDTLNPYTYYQKSMVIKNKANVAVPFSWIVVKPLLRPPDPSTESSEDNVSLSAATSSTGSTIPQQRVHDVESAFSVEPQTGSLPPSGSMEFAITFAPPQVANYHNVLHLVLRDIPTAVLQLLEIPSDDGIPEMVLPPGETDVQDMTALEIEAKGECEPFSVLLQPYALYIPGHTLVNTPIKRQFRIINASVSSIVFEWEKCTEENYIMEVEPPVGELGPQCELDFDLSVSGSVPGKIVNTLRCHVHHLDQPLTLHVEAEIKGPEVVIENSDLNFGLVRLGETVQHTIDVRNLSQVIANWNICQSPAHTDPECNSELMFLPVSGELRPLESTSVQVTFNPSRCKSLRTVIELMVDNGNMSTLAARAEVQKPQVCLLSCQLVMPEVYVDVPTIHQVSLLNQTLLPTYFEWGQLEGEDASMCSVSIEPKCADLGPREQIECSVHFTSHKQGAIKDLRMPCCVGGMDSPLYLALQCDTRGLSVSYRTPPPDDAGESSPQQPGLMLDLGCVQLGDTPVRYLNIKNNTAISAPFTISLLHFFTKPPSPPERGRPTSHLPTKSQRRAMLGKTPNLADPLSKTPSKAHADLSKAMLSRGLGAAFSATPSTGVLQPFGEQIVEITGFSDMWGQYEDQFVCKVEKLDLVHIPVRMGVAGCPLRFQMVAAQPAHQPILRFGTHVSGVAPITRQMRINNVSPCDIRLDWQTFNQDREDKQLLDFVVTYGQAFPLQDAQGAEIIPSIQDISDEELNTERQATDMIPNSPGTTPNASRQVTTLTSAGNTQGQGHPKVISLTLREHGGQEATTPFKISPSQVVIPARSNSCINASFSPLSTQEVPHGQECVGFALGYMSLSEKDESISGQVTRDQGYSVDSLRLDMNAFVKPALLTIECDEDEGMRYRTAASDLFQNRQMVGEKLHFCSATLSNHTETPLEFRLLTAEPFLLVELHSTTGATRAQLIQTDFITLKPRQNAIVQVGFRVSPELLSYIDQLESQDHANDDHQVALVTVNQERKLHFREKLTVEFNNSTTQQLPLYATLVVPSLVLTKESLDFGTCLVGQQRELQLMLSNPTGSDSFWTLELEFQSETCAESTFQVSPSSGQLEAHITHVSNSKTLIRVFFTAKHTDIYEATYVFRGMLGEEPKRLTIKGQGSYDGKHEAVVNI